MFVYKFTLTPLEPTILHQLQVTDGVIECYHIYITDIASLKCNMYALYSSGMYNTKNSNITLITGNVDCVVNTFVEKGIVNIFLQSYYASEFAALIVKM